MYKNNIYINNHEELRAITLPTGNKADMSVQFDIFDQRHGLKHDDLARAQYCHWRSIETGVPELLSVPDRNLLIENGFLSAE